MKKLILISIFISLNFLITFTAYGKTYCEISLKSGMIVKGYLVTEYNDSIQIEFDGSTIILLKKNIDEIKRVETAEAPANPLSSKTITDKNKTGHSAFKKNRANFLEILINEFQWDMELNEFEKLTNKKVTDCTKSFLDGIAQSRCIKKVLLGNYEYDVYFFEPSKNNDHSTSIKIMPSGNNFNAENHFGNIMGMLIRSNSTPKMKEVPGKNSTKPVYKINDKYIIFSDSTLDDFVLIQANNPFEKQQENISYEGEINEKKKDDTSELTSSTKQKRVSTPSSRINKAQESWDYYYNNEQEVYTDWAKKGIVPKEEVFNSFRDDIENSNMSWSEKQKAKVMLYDDLYK